MLAAAADALKRGEPVALVTIVRARGSTPQRTGAKMLVFADGRTIGTIGGGCYENDAFWKARDALATGRPAMLHFELNDDFAQENGLVCGGQMDVHIDPLAPTPRCTSSAEATSVSISGARHATPASASTSSTIVRSSPMQSASRPLRRSWWRRSVEWLHTAEIPASAFVAIVTRGHQHDLDAMRALAARDFRYLGLIGSRAKVARIFDALAAEGMPAECLARVRAPIGLAIGAVTPAEIAISILAEMIAVHRGAEANVVSMPGVNMERRRQKTEQG